MTHLRRLARTLTHCVAFYASIATMDTASGGHLGALVMKALHALGW
ncbi:MAG: hypothetical protein WCG26_04810 [Chloroflexales bacterium]